jgi:hypothetical protein
MRNVLGPARCAAAAAGTRHRRPAEREIPRGVRTRQHSIVQRLALRRKAAEQLVAQEPLGDATTAAPLPESVGGSPTVHPVEQAGKATWRDRSVVHRIVRRNGAVRVAFTDEAIRRVRFQRRLTTRQWRTDQTKLFCS